MKQSAQAQYVETTSVAPQVYTKQQMMQMLRISRSTYYKLLKDKRLLFSRLYPGGPAVHTEQQYQNYIAYLNSEGVVNGPRERSAGKAKAGVVRFDQRREVGSTPALRSS